jgi:hypothetical protein
MQLHTETYAAQLQPNALYPRFAQHASSALDALLTASHATWGVSDTGTVIAAHRATGGHP